MRSKAVIAAERLLLLLTVSLLLTQPPSGSLSSACVAAACGQEPDRFILTEGNISDHLWSSDGTKIAYVKCPDRQTWDCELWVADINPERAQLLNPRLIYTGIEWTHLEDWQGDWLLFMRSLEEGAPSEYYGVRELWKIRTDGTELTQVTFTYTNGIKYTENGYYINRGSVGWGRFIPGTNLVYFSAHNGNGWYEAYTCQADGTDQWRPISDPNYSFTIAMSPTGNKLVWGHATYWNNPTTLMASNVDGTEQLTLKVFSKRTFPLILADGKTVIYSWNDGDLYAMDLDGSNERTVLDDEYFNHWANYHPVEAQALIMESDRTDGNRHIFKINIDSTNIIQLTDGPYNDELAMYSPNGQYLLYRRLPADFDKSLHSPPYPYELVVTETVGIPWSPTESPTVVVTETTSETITTTATEVVTKTVSETAGVFKSLPDSQQVAFIPGFAGIPTLLALFFLFFVFRRRRH